MATIPVIYAAEVVGTEKVQQRLRDVAKEPQRLSSVLGELSSGIRAVGKDLDNIGLEAGKALAKTADAALSVTTAIGSGGLSAAVGLATLAVGYLAEAWASEARAAEEAADRAKKAVEEHEKAINKLVDGYKTARHKLSMNEVLEKEDEIRARRELLEKDRAERDIQLARKNNRALRNAEREEADARYEELKARVLSEGKKLNEEEAAVAARKRQLLRREEVEAELERQREAEKAAREAREQREREAEESFEEFGRYSKRVADETKAFWDRVKAVRAAEEEQERKLEKQRLDSLETVNSDTVKAEQKILSGITDAYQEMTLASAEAHARRAHDAVEADRLSVEERLALNEEFTRRLAELAEQREQLAHEARLREIEAERTLTNSNGEMIDVRLQAERDFYEARREMRERDTEAQIEAERRKAQAAREAAIQTEAAAAALASYEIAATAVRPAINVFTNQLERLGDVNRENAWEFREFIDDLPALIAKEAQLQAARVSSTAAGKAAETALDAARAFALGVTAAVTPGGQAAASGHFAGAAKLAAVAAGYAALAGAAGGTALGIGMSRGAGGIVPLTRAERERNERASKGSTSSEGISGGRLRENKGSSQFVVNVNYGPWTVAPSDEDRVARVVTSAMKRALSNAFDRRRMGA